MILPEKLIFQRLLILVWQRKKVLLQ